MAEIEYLGCIITKEGLKPAESKFRDILQVPTPKMFLENLFRPCELLATVNFCQICAPLPVSKRNLLSMEPKSAGCFYGSEVTAGFEQLYIMIVI